MCAHGCNQAFLEVRQIVTTDLSFYHVYFRNQAQVIRLGGKHHYCPQTLWHLLVLVIIKDKMSFQRNTCLSLLPIEAASSRIAKISVARHLGLKPRLHWHQTRISTCGHGSRATTSSRSPSWAHSLQPDLILHPKKAVKALPLLNIHLLFHLSVPHREFIFHLEY